MTLGLHQLWRRLVASRAAGGRSNRRRGRLAPEVAPLEDRKLAFVTQIAAVAVPNILVPVHNQFVPVTVRGYLNTTTNKFPNTATFQVIDEYRRIEPRGHLHLTHSGPNTFAFQFTVNLQAKRADESPAGRRYYVTLAAGDDDNGLGKTIPVLVPHDPRNPLNLSPRVLAGKPPLVAVKHPTPPAPSHPARAHH